MIRLIDNNKAVEISIREWDEENSQYGPDWSADFYEVGGLKTVDEPELAYIVDDVDYCIEYANDMVAVWATSLETRSRIRSCLWMNSTEAHIQICERRI